MKQYLVAAVACFALMGCATIIKGQSQSVAITTPPITGANCILMSAQGNWTVTSPGVVTVERSRANIEVRCKKDGYQEGFAVIPSNFEGWTVGNILAGGVIGLGVDAATGAINQYPGSFQVPMQPLQMPVAAIYAPPPATVAPAQPAPAQRLCMPDEAAQKRIAIQNNYTLIPNCQ